MPVLRPDKDELEYWLPPKSRPNDPCRYAVRTHTTEWVDCGAEARMRIGDDWYCVRHAHALERAESLEGRLGWLPGKKLVSVPSAG